MSSNKAIVLLSGGLDSTTTLCLAKSKGYKCLCLIFDYGQRHNKEILSAKRIAKLAHSPYKIIKLRLPGKGSSLLDKRMPIPSYRKSRKSMVRLRSGSTSSPFALSERSESKGSPSTLSKVEASIPSTYVPGRNLIFLSLAVSFAESIKAQAIFIGANSVDFSGYPDCRPEFYNALIRTIKVGTKSGVQGKEIKIYTPLIRKTKAEIVKLGFRLGVPFQYTWSCYRGDKRPCGICDSCKLRAKGFKSAGINDPLT